MLKIVNTLGACAVASMMLMQSAAADEGKLVIGEGNWVGARIMTYVLAEAIGARFPGVEVEHVPASVSVMFEAMDRGKGDIDVHPDIWLPNQASFADEYVTKRGTVKLSKGFYEGRGGYCVPRYVAEENNLKNVYDLATPQAAALFDTNGDGKGEMWIGGPGWISANRYIVQFRDYGIGNFFESVQADEAVAYAQLGDAIAKHRPYVFACYSPHYVFDLYDLVWLEEPAFDKAKSRIADPKDKDWLEKSVASTAQEPRHVFVGYSATLDKRLPEVAAFLSNVTMDTDIMTKLSAEVVQKKRDPQDVAKEWVQANAARVDRWLEGQK